MSRSIDEMQLAWKAEQRDWLLARLRLLILEWKSLSDQQHPNPFCVDEEHDRTARARTGGCARELAELLEKLS